MVENIKDTLKLYLLSKLRLHHMLYRLPAISEYLEELIAEALQENGYPNDWKPNRSHAVSKDLTLDEGKSFSIKSGMYNPKTKTLKFSGSRLGKHNTIEAMVESIEETHADFYICLAKDDKDWSKTPEKEDLKTYYLFVFESGKIDYSGVWGVSESKKGGFKYVIDKPGMHAKIAPSMSYQLWTTVDTSLIGEPEKLVV